MALMLEKTYDAFRNAGATEETARAASAELAQFENHAIKTELIVLRWMMGASLGLHILTIGLILNLSTRHL